MTAKSIITITFLVLLVGLFGRHLLPFDDYIFSFHDETQPARIQQFTANLTHLKIPPRIAPDFSFGLGYPVFHYYAPLAYWVGGIVNLFGFSVINSFKLTMFLGLLVAVIGFYLFIRLFFGRLASSVAAILYISCLYVAVDIFVRGNLAEVWFLAMLPFVLYFSERIHAQFTRLDFVGLSLALAGLLTAHNVLSLFVLPILVIYWIIFLATDKKHFWAFILALILVSSYLVPYIFQMHLVYAQEVATQTHYQDHFLCGWQYWGMSWGYGGSSLGCFDDGMSFMLGKIHITLFAFGLLITAFYILRRKLKLTIAKYNLFFSALTLGSLFMATYWAIPIWQAFSPILKFVQFPWRFIIFSLPGMAFLGGYTTENVLLWSEKFKQFKFPHRQIVLTVLFFIILLFFYAHYFKAPIMTHTEFATRYLTADYIKYKVAHKVAEYLPKTADFDTWRRLETLEKDEIQTYVNATQLGLEPLTNKPFYKIYQARLNGEVVLPVHWFPVWRVTINDQLYTPTIFNKLGMPKLKVEINDIIVLYYFESGVIRLGNALSWVGLFLIIIITFGKWPQKLKFPKFFLN